MKANRGKRNSIAFTSQPTNKNASNSRRSVSSLNLDNSENVLFDTLMNDPIKRKVLMDLLSQERENIQKYKETEDKKVTKLKRDRLLHCESPTALLRRRALQQNRRDSNSSFSSTASESKSTSSTNSIPFEHLLTGIVAYVEIHSKGEDRSASAKALMKAMGAKVKDSFSSDVTHVIFKDGSFTTFQKAKLKKVHLVSILWLEAVRKSNSRVPEKKYPPLGTESFDVDISQICSDYEKLVQEEKRRSRVMELPKGRKTALPSELQAVQSGGRLSEVIIPTSQAWEAESIISYTSGTLPYRRNIFAGEDSDRFYNSTPELTSDDDSECGVINGHSFRRESSSLDLQMVQNLPVATSTLNNTNNTSSTRSTSLLQRKSEGNRKSSYQLVDMDLTSNLNVNCDKENLKLGETSTKRRVSSLLSDNATNLLENSKQIGTRRKSTYVPQEKLFKEPLDAVQKNPKKDSVSTDETPSLRFSTNSKDSSLTRIPGMTPKNKGSLSTEEMPSLRVSTSSNETSNRKISSRISSEAVAAKGKKCLNSEDVNLNSLDRRITRRSVIAQATEKKSSLDGQKQKKRKADSLELDYQSDSEEASNSRENNQRSKYVKKNPTTQISEEEMPSLKVSRSSNENVRITGRSPRQHNKQASLDCQKAKRKIFDSLELGGPRESEDDSLGLLNVEVPQRSLKEKQLNLEGKKTISTTRIYEGNAEKRITRSSPKIHHNILIEKKSSLNGQKAKRKSFDSLELGGPSESDDDSLGLLNVEEPQRSLKEKQLNLEGKKTSSTTRICEEMPSLKVSSNSNENVERRITRSSPKPHHNIVLEKKSSLDGQKVKRKVFDSLELGGPSKSDDGSLGLLNQPLQRSLKEKLLNILGEKTSSTTRISEEMPSLRVSSNSNENVESRITRNSPKLHHNMVLQKKSSLDGQKVKRKAFDSIKLGGPSESLGLLNVEAPERSLTEKQGLDLDGKKNGSTTRISEEMPSLRVSSTSNENLERKITRSSPKVPSLDDQPSRTKKKKLEHGGQNSPELGTAVAKNTEPILEGMNNNFKSVNQMTGSITSDDIPSLRISTSESNDNIAEKPRNSGKKLKLVAKKQNNQYPPEADHSESRKNTQNPTGEKPLNNEDNLSGNSSKDCCESDENIVTGIESNDHIVETPNNSAKKLKLVAKKQNNQYPPESKKSTQTPTTEKSLNNEDNLSGNSSKDCSESGENIVTDTDSPPAKELDDNVNQEKLKNKTYRKLYNLNQPPEEILKDWREDFQTKSTTISSSEVPKKTCTIPLVPISVTPFTKQLIEKRKKEKQSNKKKPPKKKDPPKQKDPPKPQKKVQLNCSKDEQKELTDEYVNNKQNPMKLRNKDPARISRRSQRVSLCDRINYKEKSFTSDSEEPIRPELNRRSTFDFVQSSQTKSQRKKKVQKRTSIVCTRFHKPEVQTFIQVVRKLGSFFVEDEVTNKTTHLVMGETKRTINLLKALTRGCWILTQEWLYRSLEVSKWLPEEDFEVTDFSPAVQICRRERQAFGSSYSMDIFENCGPIYIARSSIPRRSDLKELVELCQGSITNVAYNANVVVGEWVRYENVACVTEMWILDSISFNKRKSFKHYLIERSSS